MHSKRIVAARGVLQLLIGSSRTASARLVNQNVQSFSVVNIENVGNKIVYMI